MPGGCMGRSGPAALVSDEAVANCRKHSGGNHASALSSRARGQHPNSLSGLKSKWRLSYILSGSFKGRLYSLVCFPVYKGHLHLLAYVLFLHLQSQQHNIFSSLSLSTSFFHILRTLVII